MSTPYRHRRLRKPKGAPVEAASIEIARSTDRLQIEHGAQPVLGRLRNDRSALDIRHDAARHGLCDHATSERAPVLEV